MECPCINCITKAICRHRSYYELVKCPLLKELYSKMHIINDGMAPHGLQKDILIKALKPTNWSIDEKGWVQEGNFIGHPGNDGEEELK